jgi:tetratricopeptide (TPR) repeat protein
MWIPRHKYVLYGMLFLLGMGCLALALQQHRYTRLLTAGHRAAVEQRFNSQDYEQASHLWFASQERLLFNQGVLAYKAGHLPRATDLFRQISQSTPHHALRARALYNLSVVLLELQDAQKAVDLLKEALRLDPRDQEAKLALEQLYHMVQSQSQEHREAADKQGDGRVQEGEVPLTQAPGLEQEEGKTSNSSGDGHGRSAERPGI